MMSTRTDKLEKDMKKHGSDPQDLMRMGQAHLQNGDFKEARMRFRLALLFDPRLASKVALSYEGILDKDPDNVNARLSLADLHLYLGEVEGAISELQEILEIAPERSDIYNILGKLFIKQGDVDCTIEVIEAAVKAGVKDTGLTEMLAGAYIEKGRINDAISLYTGLVAIQPDNKNYLRILGELQTRVSLYDEAAGSFYSMLNSDTTLVPEVMLKLEDLKKRQPGNIQVKHMLADVYLKAIKPSQAVAELDDVLTMDPASIDTVISALRSALDKYPDEPSALKALGRALTIKGHFSEAVDEYKKMMERDDTRTDEAIAGFKEIISKYPGQAHAHESLSDAYLRSGKTEEALLENLELLGINSGAAKSVIEKCLKIIKESPNNILARRVMGQAYILADDGKPAIEEAEYMIYLDKNYAPAYQILGEANLMTGNFLKSQSSFISAINLDPYNIFFHKKYEEAARAFLKEEISRLTKKMDEDPWRMGAHLDIAKAYLMLRDLDKGIKELQLAVKDSARAPFAYNLLGLTFMESGRFDLASIQFERALEAIPGELGDVAKSIRFNLGSSGEAMGDVSAALAEYEKLLAEDAGFAGLQSRIESLTGINPDSQRNKLIAAVIEKYGDISVIGAWGRDARRGDRGDALNMSFGQEHNVAGFDHFIKGRYKAASEEFELAVQLDPKFIPALNNLAVMFMREKRLEQAETRIQLLLSMDPGSAVARNNMGVCLFLKNEIEPAVIEFNKAIEYDPGLSAAFINLGDIMYSRGLAKNAIALWEKAKTGDPLSPLAQRRLYYKTAKT
jgi:tetratricopeptide (TPR) repeat protein